MKKDLFIVFLLALISVTLIIAGLYVIATMPVISHRGHSNIPSIVFMSGLLFMSAIGTSSWLSAVIHNADREIITWDDEDAYEYFSREIAEMEAENTESKPKRPDTSFKLME
jgi:arginine exporter protein ArgO